MMSSYHIFATNYKVIPLTPTVGIVEWVKGTLPIGNYLNKTHEKYKRPTDYLPSVARRRMGDAAKQAQQQQKRNNRNRGRGMNGN